MRKPYDKHCKKLCKMKLLDKKISQLDTSYRQYSNKNNKL